MATNPSYKPNEGKREEFRRYLEKTGVMDALTKVLVLLYEETDKPDDALTFIQNTLAKQSGTNTVDEMKQRLTELQDRVTQLEEENTRLHESLAAETVEGEGEEGALPEGGEVDVQLAQTQDAPPPTTPTE